MPARAARKSASKSASRAVVPTAAAKAVPGRPFTGRGDPRNGRGPAKGAPNAGRPPDEFKALCASLASGEETVAAVTSILANPQHPHFMAALKWASDRGYGQPAQPLTGANGDGPIAHRVEVAFVRPDARPAEAA
jgi:hypothetical protein